MRRLLLVAWCGCIILAMLASWSLQDVARPAEAVNSKIGPDSQPVSDIQGVLNRRFAHSTTITFLSWNGGHSPCADCETDIRLNSDGTALLTEYTDAKEEFKGNYSIGNDHLLTLTLKNYPSDWPTMTAYEDGSVLLLMPSDGSTDFAFSHHGGVKTYEKEGNTFWPFREIQR